MTKIVKIRTTPEKVAEIFGKLGNQIKAINRTIPDEVENNLAPSIERIGKKYIKKMQIYSRMRSELALMKPHADEETLALINKGELQLTTYEDETRADIDRFKKKCNDAIDKYFIELKMCDIIKIK
jgi:hypothetical protein